MTTFKKQKTKIEETPIIETKWVEDIKAILQPYFDHQLEGFLERKKLRDVWWGGKLQGRGFPVFVDLKDPKFLKKFLKNVGDKTRDTYFGIIPRLKNKDGKGRSCKDSFTPYLIIDVDCKDHDAAMTFKNFASNLQDLKPTFLVFSGRGFHLYFQLEKPLPACLFGQAQKILIQRFQQLIVESNLDTSKFHVDEKITDIPRVLRLPGTINSKSNYRCTVVEKNEIKYALETLVGDVELKEPEEKPRRTYKKTDDKNPKEESELYKKLNEYYQQRNSKPIDRYNHYYLDYRNIRIFFNALKNLLLPYYVPGNRHTLIMYVAGICAKLKIWKNLCEDFYKNHFQDKDGDEYVDRLNVITDTYRKLQENPKEPIRSFTLLEALNFNPEEFGLKVTVMVKCGYKFIPLEKVNQNKKEAVNEPSQEMDKEEHIEEKTEKAVNGINNEINEVFRKFIEEHERDRQYIN